MVILDWNYLSLGCSFGGFDVKGEEVFVHGFWGWMGGGV